MSYEVSYTISLIMPCFYYKDMDANNFIERYNLIYNNYQKFCNGKTLDSETTIFGFALIFYFVLLKSNNIILDNKIHEFYKEKIDSIQNEINGFNFTEIKKEISKILSNKSSSIDSIRQMNCFNNNNRIMLSLYLRYFDYCKDQKIRFEKKETQKMLKIKKVYIALSECFHKNCKFKLILETLKINKKDVEYFYTNELGDECSCQNTDCKNMINFFNNE